MQHASQCRAANATHESRASHDSEKFKEQGAGWVGGNGVSKRLKTEGEGEGTAESRSRRQQNQLSMVVVARGSGGSGDMEHTPSALEFRNQDYSASTRVYQADFYHRNREVCLWGDSTLDNDAERWYGERTEKQKEHANQL